MASIWRVLCPVFVVLASGLVAGGCSKEEKSFDVFVAPEPRVVRADGATPLRAWDQTNNRSLDLHDSIDFSETKAAKATVTASCYFLNEFHTTSFYEAKDPKKIRIFQILPQEILSVDFEASKPKCSFVISLFNSTGSAHIFPATSAPIKDSGAALVEVTRDGFVRYPPVTNGELGGVCNDMTTPRIPFRSVSEKKYVDFNSPILRDKRFENTLLLKPKQNCRLGVFQNGELVALSTKFEEIVGWLPMPSTLEYQAKGDVDPSDPTTFDSASFFSRGVDKELMRISFSNPSPAPRMILVPKFKFPAIYEMFSVDQLSNNMTGSGFKYPVPRSWIYLVPHIRGATKVSDSNNHWLITLENKDDSFALSMYAAAAPGDRCVPAKNNPAAVLIYPASPVFITEVMDGEIKIQDVTINLSDKVMIGFGSSFRRDQVEKFELLPNTYCNWPL